MRAFLLSPRSANNDVVITTRYRSPPTGEGRGTDPGGNRGGRYRGSRIATTRSAILALCEVLLVIYDTEYGTYLDEIGPYTRDADGAAPSVPTIALAAVLGLLAVRLPLVAG